jgi:hypothetical protein
MGFLCITLSELAALNKPNRADDRYSKPVDMFNMISMFGIRLAVFNVEKLL